MNVNITTQQEIKRMIKEQSDKDKDSFWEIINKLHLRINDLEQMK